MCKTYLVRSGGDEVWCETVGELAAVLGVSPESLDEGGSNFCLCNVDHTALGATVATQEEGFPRPWFVIDRDKSGVVESETEKKQWLSRECHVFDGRCSCQPGKCIGNQEF